MTDKPILIESLNLLKFDFQNGITVELHHLDDKGKAEIWTRHNNGTAGKLVDVSELNLLASRSRDEFILSLYHRTEICQASPRVIISMRRRPGFRSVKNRMCFPQSPCDRFL